LADIVVVAGYTVAGFAESLAKSLGGELVSVESKVFPDGEAYVRVPRSVRGSVAVVVETMYPEQDRRFLELLMLADALRGLGAARVVAVTPYLAYARQDKRFLAGEPITIAALLRSLGAVGYEALVAVDVHKPESLAYFPGPSANVLPAQAFAEKLASIAKPSDTVVIAPDRGALGRARALAELLGTDYDYLEKHRDKVTGEVTYKPKTVTVADKTIVLVDDIISTGGTIAKSARMLREQGAKKIVVACSHALLVGNAMEKIKGAGVEKLYAANTVPTPAEVEVVDVAPLVADKLKQLLETL